MVEAGGVEPQHFIENTQLIGNIGTLITRNTLLTRFGCTWECTRESEGFARSTLQRKCLA
jgi:hypothetical protein